MWNKRIKWKGKAVVCGFFLLRMASVKRTHAMPFLGNLKEKSLSLFRFITGMGFLRNKHKEREFEELFKQNYSRLFYYALDCVEDEEASRDIVSEVFGEAWTRRDQLCGADMVAYLVRSVRNRSLNYLKHKTVVENYRRTVQAVREQLVEEDVEVHEARLQVVDAVMKNLSPQTREIFQLCYYEGKTYAETAELVGLGTGAVHKHVSKALAAFRQAFCAKNVKWR